MNLKTYLLTRMLGLGLLCWMLISIYVTVRTQHEVRLALESDGKRLHEMVEYGMYKRQVAPENEGAPVLVGNQYGLVFAPYCVEYVGWNGQMRQESCHNFPQPTWALRLLKGLALHDLPIKTEVGLWGQPFGELTVKANPKQVLARFWSQLQDLLLLTSLILISLGALSYWVIGRAFRPTRTLVEALDAITPDHPNANAALPRLQPHEFDLIARGVDRLNHRIANLDNARQLLTRKLLDVQENERREVAHWIHADLGQALSVVNLHAAHVRRKVHNSPLSLDEELEALDTSIEQAFQRMRSVLINKCPPVLDGSNTLMTFEDLCTRWRLDAGPPWTVDLHLDTVTLNGLSKDLSLCVYRTLEECLQNALKYGDPSHTVHVYLDTEQKQVRLKVVNGVPTVRAAASPGGMGLQLLQERVRVHGGLLSSGMDYTGSTKRYVVLAQFPQSGVSA